MVEPTDKESLIITLLFANNVLPKIVSPPIDKFSLTTTLLFVKIESFIDNVDVMLTLLFTFKELLSIVLPSIFTLLCKYVCSFTVKLLFKYIVSKTDTVEFIIVLPSIVKLLLKYTLLLTDNESEINTLLFV